MRALLCGTGRTRGCRDIVIFEMRRINEIPGQIGACRPGVLQKAMFSIPFTLADRLGNAADNKGENEP
jgi:hypothetical protein